MKQTFNILIFFVIISSVGCHSSNEENLTTVSDYAEKTIDSLDINNKQDIILEYTPSLGHTKTARRNAVIFEIDERTFRYDPLRHFSKKIENTKELKPSKVRDVLNNKKIIVDSLIQDMPVLQFLSEYCNIYVLVKENNEKWLLKTEPIWIPQEHIYCE